MDSIPDNIKNHDFFLWEQFRQGDKSALHKIYTGHYAAMLDYGLRLTDDRAFVIECIQQVFRNVISRLDRLNHINHIRFYLLLALRRHIFEHTTKGKMLKNKFQQVNGNGFHYNPNEQSVADLNFREKEAMYLKFHQQLNDMEISRMIGLTNGSARELLVKALRKYRTHRDATNHG